MSRSFCHWNLHAASIRKPPFLLPFPCELHTRVRWLAASGSFLSMRCRLWARDITRSLEEWLRLTDGDELGDGETGKFQAGEVCREAARGVLGHLLTSGALAAPSPLRRGTSLHSPLAPGPCSSFVGLNSVSLQGPLAEIGSAGSVDLRPIL